NSASFGQFDFLLPYEQLSEAFYLVVVVLADYPLSTIHSILSATIGLTFAARRAGNQQAINAAPARSNATEAKVTGSVGLTSWMMLRSTRVVPHDPNSPSAMPTAVSRQPRRSTPAMIVWRQGPSAMRQPISGVRWLTR